MSVTPEDLKVAYLLGRENNNELSPEMLHKKGWSNEKVMQVMNNLVDKRLCALRKNRATGKVWVKVREEDIAQAIRSLPAEDYAVYCCIEDAGNVGMWTHDITKQAGLQSHVVQRAVKTLADQKKLIKPLKSIHQKNRKIYILANIEPAKEIVGGTFYDNAEFDEGLVERLREQIIHILKNGTQASLVDISNYVRSSGFGKDLNDEDLKLVLRTLQLEQQIQSSISPGTGNLMYTWCRWGNDPTDTLLHELPCAMCPVIHECVRGSSDNRVSPFSCQYYDYWLNYETDFDNTVVDNSKTGSELPNA